VGAGGGDAGQEGRGVAWGHGATLMATVTPSRKGTSVVTKSGEA
jgi:hypothetical protein